MTNIDDMFIFLQEIYDRGLMTKFLINIFNYDGLEDYNYISRVSKNNNAVILDVYDNVSKNRFNRYYFSFDKKDSQFNVKEINNVFVTNISVLSILDNDNKLFKLAYLFKLDKKDRIKYAKTFLMNEFIDMLK